LEQEKESGAEHVAEPLLFNSSTQVKRMRTHPCAAIGVLTLALLLETAAPGQAQQPKKGARDFAQLMPASSLLYAEMTHPQMVKQLLGMIKGSAFSDYAGFRDDLYQRLKIEAGSEGHVTRSSAFWAAVITPELLKEISRIKGFAVAVTGFKEGPMGRQTSFVWVIDPGSSNLAPLIARDILTLSASMKSVRKVEGVRLYQSFQPNRKVQKARNDIDRVESAANNYLRDNKKLAALEDLLKWEPKVLPEKKILIDPQGNPFQSGDKEGKALEEAFAREMTFSRDNKLDKTILTDPWGKPYQFAVKEGKATVWSDSPLGKITLSSGPEKGAYEPVGAVMATMPGLIVVGSDADVVADVILRDRGNKEKVTSPALTDLPEFQQFAAARKNPQLFGFANLGAVESKQTALPDDFRAGVHQLKSLLGPDSCKELAAAFWLDDSGPHLDMTVKLGSKTPGPLVQLVSKRTLNPRVLHFAPDDSFVTMSAPLGGQPDDYAKLLVVLQKWAANVRPLESHNFTTHAHLTPDGRRLVTSTREGLKLWDLESGQILRTIPVASGGKNEPWPHRLLDLALSADGKRIVTVERGEAVSEKGEPRPFLVVTVRDAETGKPLHTGKMDFSDSLAISADGKRLAFADSSSRLRVVATADPGKILYTLDPEPKIEEEVNSICISPDGKQIACGSRKGGIKVWTLEPKSQFHRIKTGGHSVMTMSFSPDGKYLAVGGYGPEYDDRSVTGKTPFTMAFAKVFDAVKGEVSAFEVQRGTVASIRYAPDGKHLLLATDTQSSIWPNDPRDKSIKVWDLDKNKDVLTLQGYSPLSMALSADGKRIVSVNKFGQIKVRDGRDGKEVLSLAENPLTDLIRQIGLGLATPQGKELATAARSVSLAVCPENTPGSWQALVVLEMKDEASAKAFMDLVPFLLGKGQKAQTQKFGKHTIHTLAVEKNNWEFALEGLLSLRWHWDDQSYGREGNVVVLGPSAKTVARSLQGGAAGKGFAAQPDVAKTLTGVKDVNGLILWSSRNLVNHWLRLDEAELAGVMKQYGGKSLIDLRDGNLALPKMERDLLLHWPQQFKKITADLTKAVQDRPAGSLTATVKSDRLTISGSQPGLQAMMPRLIDALVEWDLSRPNLGRRGVFMVEPKTQSQSAPPGNPPRRKNEKGPEPKPFEKEPPKSEDPPK
jgi:WD40 repeat protein